MKPIATLAASLALALAVATSFAERARAHCDTVDGPVVVAARKALEASDVLLVLPWVGKDREPEIREAFRRTLAVRALSPEAKDLADTWFFETIVRVHRAGEGEPYTGLKPAGSPVEPAIAAADRAVETGTLAPLDPYVPANERAAFEAALKKVLSLRDYAKDDVEAGRAYVHAYVEFLHRLEHASPKEAGAPVAAGTITSPKALAAEHAELHERLAEAMNAGGAVAEAARALAKVLHPHFVREEQIAMPPLSLLPALSEGRVTPDMRPALEMTRALRRELPRMLQEHVAIKAGFRALGEAAKRENNVRIARFADRLILHAETEEQVLYPAALVVGDVLEQRLAK